VTIVTYFWSTPVGEIPRKYTSLLWIGTAVVVACVAKLFARAAAKDPIICEDCFYYCLERNNVVVLFGTLKVQSFILTEVSDCGLLIVVTSSTFLKRKDMLKEKSS